MKNVPFVEDGDVFLIQKILIVCGQVADTTAREKA